MRPKPCPLLEKGRIRTGPLGSDVSCGNNGAFSITGPKGQLVVVASDGMGWEHVSVRPAKAKRTPTWEEMHFVKTLLWMDTECVVQYHPPQSDYINLHPYVLHMWRPTEVNLPVPPVWMV